MFGAAYPCVHVLSEGAAPLVVCWPLPLLGNFTSTATLHIRLWRSPRVHNGLPAVHVSFAPISWKLQDMAEYESEVMFTT